MSFSRIRAALARRPQPSWVRSATSTSDGRINCGGTCSTLYPSGATITLIASTSGGAKFTGWTGACSGTSSNCAVLVDAHLNVGATFTSSSTTTTTTTTASATTTTAPTTTTTTTTSTPLVTLSIGLSNKRSVVSENGAIDCPGGSCSAKFPVGSTVTVLAVPTVGAFQGWTDACTGTAPTCTLTILKDSKFRPRSANDGTVLSARNALEHPAGYAARGTGAVQTQWQTIQ